MGRSPPVGTQAVVVGAGMAGLAAARALADHFERVIVLERDELPPDSAHRAGTPQSRHLHGLLAGGSGALNDLFPGFEDDLDRAGAVPLRVGLDVRVERPGYHPFPQRDLGWLTRSLSRPLLELTLRQRVAQCANIELRHNCRVQKFVAAPDAASIVGVGCENAGGSGEMVPADLVVDASGRGSLTLELLQSAGLTLPEETSIGIDIEYATSVFAIPDDAPTDWKGVMVAGAAPEDTRGALMLPIEGNRWIVSLGEAHSNGLPADEAGFLSWAQTLPTPTIYTAIKHAERLGDVVRFRFPASVRRHYERISGFPRGLLPLGDALCRFNPGYGQGMSVAAQEARLLGRLLSTPARGDDPLANLAPTFFAQAQTLLDTPWAVATMDFIFPQTRGQCPANFEGILRFSRALNRLAARDPAVHKLVIEVQSLLRPGSAYGDPELLRQLTAVMAEA
jgi:2-polyprenyl-6-methoxyphenol hydroxylase-like FAD-dependent oxidoreductase